MFTIYTQENCPNCTMLKSFLNDNNIKYNELDINNSFEAKAKMIMNDIETTPAVSINDNMFSGNLDVLKSKILEMKND